MRRRLLFLLAFTIVVAATALQGAETAASRCARLLDETKELVWEASQDSSKAGAKRQKHREAFSACREEGVPASLVSRAYVASAIDQSNDRAEAIALLHEGLAHVGKVEGPEGPAAIVILDWLASMHNSDDARSQGRLFAERALALRKRHFGDISEETALGITYLATFDRADGNDSLAEKRYREAVQIARTACGERRPCEALGSALSGIARMIRKDPDRVEEADAMLDDIIEALDGQRPPGPPRPQ
ncbi:MAG TPA: hypothetical protein VF618_04920 [Thermoanaerobaculia bacterium]